MYLCVCMHMSVYTRICFFFLCACLCWLCVYMCICMCACVVSVFTCTCVYRCMFVYGLCVCLWLFVLYVSTWMYTRVCLCWHVFLKKLFNMYPSLFIPYNQKNLSYRCFSFEKNKMQPEKSTNLAHVKGSCPMPCITLLYQHVEEHEQLVWQKSHYTSYISASRSTFLPEKFSQSPLLHLYAC